MRAPRRRYAPGRAPALHRIVRRDGLFLSDASAVPFTWTAREALALGFRSREAAERFVERRFAGRQTASEVSGIRVYRG